MAKEPKSKPIPQDWGVKAAEEALKQRAAEMQARLEEQRRQKGYEDFLKYARQYDNLEKVAENPPSFPTNLKFSAYDTVAPYYGSELQNQYLAAQEYAKQLSESNSPRVTIDPSYYQDFVKQVPVITAPLQAHYNATKDFLSLPNPVEDASVTLSMSPQSLLKNNYGNIDAVKDYLRSNMSNSYRDTAEHEAGHIPDKQITFAAKPPVTIDNSELSAMRDLGYMTQENHLVTGLSKVQREQYSMTGKRFDSPDEFKSFIFNLSQSPDIEKAISSFSEEARRTLRPQINNAKLVKDYYNKLESWKNSKSWLKGFEPKIQGNPDLLEKSAQLIPALVSNQDYTNYQS